MALKHKNKTKKKLTAVIISLVTLIPALTLLFVILSFHPGRLNADNIVSITISSRDDEPFVYVDRDVFGMYADIYEKSVQIDTPAHDISSYKVFTVEIDRKSDDMSFELMLTDSPGDCLIRRTTEKGTIYKNISPEYASAILLDDNFSKAYTYYMPPSAKISVTDKSEALSPYEMDWSYRKSDGKFYVSDIKHFISAKIPVYDYNPDKGSVEISFELVPDAVSVQVFDGANSVFNGKYGSEEYKSFKYNKKSTLEYIFTAEWYENSSAKYHGKAIYKVHANYILTPVGLLSSSKIANGEFSVLSIYNTADGEALTLEGEDAAFYKNGDAKIMYCTAYNSGFFGQKHLNVTDSNGNAVSHFIEIADADTSHSYQLHESLPDDLYTLNYKALPPAMAHITESISSNSGKMWEGEFISPLDNGQTLIAYGARIQRGQNEIGKADFMLLSSSSCDVKSIGAGTVVFSGALEPYGNTIVIDHGMGICSFYSNLDSLYYVKGDSVTKGLIVAKLNIVSGAALQYGVFVDKKLIDPLKLNFCLETAGLI